jgi:hypothetical protein
MGISLPFAIGGNQQILYAKLTFLLETLKPIQQIQKEQLIS